MKHVKLHTLYKGKTNCRFDRKEVRLIEVLDVSYGYLTDLIDLSVRITSKKELEDTIALLNFLKRDLK